MDETLTDLRKLEGDPDGSIRDRLNAILDAAAEAIVIVDAGERVIFANTAVEPLLGWTPAALLGVSFETIIPRLPRDKKGKLLRHREGSRERRPARATLVLAMRASRGVMPVEITMSRVDSWRAGAIAVVMRDATDRLENERALRESEERFRLVAQTSKDVLYEWDPERGTVWFGDALTQHYGYPANAIANGNVWWLDHIHHEDLQAVTERLEKLRASAKASWSVEYRFRRADGSYVDVFDRCVVQRDEAGGVKRAVGVMMDISERRRAEEERRELELEQARLTGRLQLLLDRMPMACLLNDENFCITYWNAAAERIFGWGREDVLGKNPLDILVPPEGRDFIAALEEKMALGHGGERNEHENITKDGRIIVCEWYNTAIFDERGVFVGSLAMAQDVTERRALEQQLLHAQKMDGMGRLAGGVAHDFNNLLTAILGNAAIVRNSLAPDDPRVVDLDQIRSASLRAAELTQQLLAFARRQVVSPRVVELNRAMLRTDRLLRRLLGEEIEIVTLPSADSVRVRIDPAKLEQLIVNLAVNARDAMPEGGTLTIAVRAVELPAREAGSLFEKASQGKHAQLMIRDTGTGIDPAHIPRIFEPFFTTKEPDRGTGLGLSICYGIAKQAGGELSVTSRMGEGSTFTMSLPATEELEIEESTSVEHLPRRGSETILVVEDEPRILRMLTQAMRESGYRVLAAESGAEAISLAVSHPGTIDLMVTDLVMPRMSGRQLARELSARGLVSRVLFVSGYADDHVAGLDGSDPNVQLLEKPFTGYDVARKVRQFLDRRSPSK